MNKPDMVHHPAHYTRGPVIKVLVQGKWEPVDRVIECIEVIRHIRDDEWCESALQESMRAKGWQPNTSGDYCPKCGCQ